MKYEQMIKIKYKTSDNFFLESLQITNAFDFWASNTLKDFFSVHFKFFTLKTVKLYIINTITILFF